MIPKSATLFREEFQHRLLQWFDVHGRSFPWRSVERAAMKKPGEAIHDPWMILVSEVMLQQTQTSRVVEKLPLFLEQFPTVEALARASRAELLRAWQGMGYNSRALRLQETAKAITNDHNKVFPQDYHALLALPGVGPYTASAILCFAFSHDVPVIDVNISRLLSRIFYKCYTPAQVLPEKSLGQLAEYLLPVGDSYRYHQALMDLGATVCTARAPQCDSCPLLSFCLSAQFRDVQELFNPASTRPPEPMFLGEPRRLWRGRIVEALRGVDSGMKAEELMQQLIPVALFVSVRSKEQRDFFAIVDGLLRDGLVERTGVVREGSVGAGDVLQLPEN